MKNITSWIGGGHISRKPWFKRNDLKLVRPLLYAFLVFVAKEQVTNRPASMLRSEKENRQGWVMGPFPRLVLPVGTFPTADEK